MSTRLFALLIPAALAACAAGSTIRPSDGKEASSNEPVSLAPAPSGEAEPPAPSTQPADKGQAAPALQPQDSATPAQGYAPYGASARTLDLRRIGQWTRTGIGESRRLVIRDASTWDEFWSELAVGDRPSVDFTRDVVVAVAAGQRPTGGYEIAVNRITQTNGELTVEVVE